MKISHKKVQEATIYLGEKVNISNSDKLKEHLQSLYAGNYRTIAIDFSETKLIDSACLGMLLMFQKKIKENNGELIIINVTSDYIRKMFDLIHLHKVINIVD